MKIVISQPMFFPWVGMFEQIRLADTYVHYSDVQFSKGSFVNRVQIKTDTGIKWLTVPLEKLRLGQSIDEVRINDQSNWRDKHLTALRLAYVNAPCFQDMMDLVESVYVNQYETIDQLSEASLNAVCRYFHLEEGRSFISAKTLEIVGSSSRRVLDIVLALGGDRYITGLGALRYLDHQLFEDNGVSVEYMNYRKAPYAQLHGAFTPFVSVLDLIANEGTDGLKYINSGTTYWKELLNHGSE
ncbi:WbqC family protein [Mariprofundus ferrooxydans]|uniref:WbqC family protein n=1 Tax=Mariprofundus ferrooxydans TaxID=314344 RepID=UPI0014307E50|nr:WbqC family protein [Mariprofundus ferrooxydans]